MNIMEEYFDKISSSEKTYEIRLYDEKRKNIKRGDMIIFQCDKREIRVYVDNLLIFSTFEEMLNSLPCKKLGFSTKARALKVYNQIYQNKKALKVLAIKLRK